MDHLETEGRNPASEHLDALSPLELVRLMNSEDARVIDAVASQADSIAQAIEIIADRFRQGGRLIYIGAGTSGRLGVLDASECPPTFNSPPEQVVGLIAGGPTALTRAVEGAEDHPEYGEADLKAIALSANDVLVGIATSGRTPYVLGAIAYARSLGAYTIGLACTSTAELSELVDLAIVPIVGPEVLTGSTRLKAGTATKLVLNMLTTGSMVRLGKSFGNLMVDLRATNIKLQARTNRIIRQVVGVDHATADALLQQCGGELKTALVAALGKLSPDESRQRLRLSQGRVREALPIRPQSDKSLSLGIDGGGSHTVALLAREGVLIGRGEAGPSNLRAVGEAKAFQALDTAITRAFTAAALPRGSVGRACLGLAGAGRESERERFRAWASRVHLAESVSVVTDAELLLAAGTPEGWGLALVAGTGSIAWGRTADGRQARAGGWGYLLGDQGSGYALAMQALRTILQTADGTGPATALSERIPEHLQISDLYDLIPLVHGGPLDRAALAALATVVLDAAAEGDAVALTIVEEQAEQLARTALAAISTLGISRFPLALAGGLLLANADYRERVLERIRQHAQPAPITLVREPAEGALRLCQRLAST